MSMTLILWKAPVTDDSDEAERLLKPWYESEDDSAFEPSEDIATVAGELRRLYPYRILSNEETVARMSDEERAQYSPDALKEIIGVDHDGPWADLPFYESDRLLSVDIRWSADDSVFDDITRLAREHRLVLFDPQGPDVALPDDPIDTGPTPPPTLRDWLGLIAIAACLCALTYAAWLIPIWWLKWPAVIVAGFFAAAGLFALGAAVAGTLGFIDVNDSPATCAEDEPPL